MASPEPPAFSVLILTFNEENQLADCLDSVAWADDVVVLDSFSTDRTAEIARARGCRVFERRFDDFAGQRNWALDHLTFEHDWVFHLDADERFTAELRDECHAAASRGEHSGYFVASKLIFMGRWLRHAAAYPVYQLRFHRLGAARFVQHGHGQREAEASGELGRLGAAYLHYSFARGLTEWLERHNRYSQQEAEAELLESAQPGSVPWRSLLGRDPLARRRALLRLRRRLPLRPWLRFAYFYFLRKGFLDGVPGLRYSTLQALFEYLIVIKSKELRRRAGGA